MTPPEKLHCTILAIAFAILCATRPANCGEPVSDDKPPRIAAIVTAYYHNSHADVIVSRLLEGYTLNGKGDFPSLKLASLYIDQFPENDKGRKLADQHKVPIYKTVAEALTLGGDKLAVDGVLLIAEHGNYPKSKTGQTVYPKKRLFGEVVSAFQKSGKVVPVFVDKHLADNWADAKWLFDTAEHMKIPLMAGSSLPTLWRYPPIDVRRNAQLKEVVIVSYHTLDAYGFHALEFTQALAERRVGGETGVKSVQCIEGDAVWQAGKRGEYDRQLLTAALSRLRERPLPKDKPLEEIVKKPSLMSIHYRDGLRVNVLTLNYAVSEWTAAWRYADSGEVESTLFWTQEARPYMHFTYLLKGVEQMMHSGKPTWHAQRTLLTSGTLHAAHLSLQKGRRIQTPYLDIDFNQSWNWKQPPPPPPGRPSKEQ
jgi:hypothetical protein